VPLSRNLGTLNTWNPLGLSRPVTGLLYLYIYIYICFYSVCSWQRRRRLFVRRSVTTDDWARSQASLFQIYGKRSSNGTCLLPNSLVFPLSVSFRQCSILILINTSGRRKETFTQHCYFRWYNNSTGKQFYYVFF